MVIVQNVAVPGLEPPVTVMETCSVYVPDCQQCPKLKYREIGALIGPVNDCVWVGAGVKVPVKPVTVHELKEGPERVAV